jgi:hypothetical protein
VSLDRYLEPIATKLGTAIAYLASGSLVVADWFLQILNNNAGAFGVIFAGITTYITWYYKRKDHERRVEMYAAGRHSEPSEYD